MKSSSENAWRRHLRCPVSKQPLELEGDRYTTKNGHSYPVVNQIPILIAAKDNRLATPEGRLMSTGYRQSTSRSWMKRLRTVITSEYFPGREHRQAKSEVLQHGALRLIIGSGVTQYPNAIHLDIDAFPGVDVVGNAERLPFADQSLDAVVCEVVLEHVAKANVVIEETFRVLKPGGKCFFIVPFLFPYHGHPSDYRRWTKEGLAVEFEAFQQLDIGIHAGPCSGLVNILSEWAYVVTGLTYPRGYALVKGGVTAILFPMKFLDYWINHFPEAHRLASTMFVKGIKAG